MFFEKELISVNLLDVLYIKQGISTTSNSERNYNAISFRINSDTIIKTKNQELAIKSNSITYFPSRVNYERITKAEEMIIIHFDTTNYQSEKIETFTAKNPQIFHELFSKILLIWSKKEVGYKYKCSALFYEILSECHIQNSNKKPQSSKNQRA